MSDSTSTEAEPAPERYDQFIADLKARVRAAQRGFEAAFPGGVVAWPGADGFPGREIARINS
ncbi:hypothetical protein [Promicromonospora panici]|uniref:hypothetical protein n=1 Tax=Promicromonospora panici TaxID=2219658 RepID=UPI00101E115D|nr:hypothetical protein [Promicromonospora panici]